MQTYIADLRSMTQGRGVFGMRILRYGRVPSHLQEQIVADINDKLLGRTVEILVEEKHRGRWKGRTRTNKIVFFEDESGQDWQGQLVEVEITWTGPWSMRGVLPGQKSPNIAGESIVIPLMA